MRPYFLDFAPPATPRTNKIKDTLLNGRQLSAGDQQCIPVPDAGTHFAHSVRLHVVGAERGATANGSGHDGRAMQYVPSRLYSTASFSLA